MTRRSGIVRTLVRAQHDAELRRAAHLNFGAVEFWWPGEENLAAVAQRVQATGLRVALMNFDVSNMAGGDRGFLNDPVWQKWFSTHVPQALAAIDELDYQSYIGLEYNPGTNSEASFSWLPANRRGPVDMSKSGEG